MPQLGSSPIISYSDHGFHLPVGIQGFVGSLCAISYDPLHKGWIFKPFHRQHVKNDPFQSNVVLIWTNYGIAILTVILYWFTPR